MIYEGNLYIEQGDTTDYSKLTKVTGDLHIYSNSNADLKALKSVGGDLYISSKISLNLAKNLWTANRKKKTKWYVCNLVPEWLIERVATKKDTIYKINRVSFTKEWFDKIRKDQLTPDEVFAIDNVEHRRVAYEMMDKTKMKSLKDYKVLDEQTDKYGNQMKVVSFTVQNMDEPLKFFNCFCPTTKREYFLGTNKDTCVKAKNALAGFNDNDEVEYIEEW